MKSEADDNLELITTSNFITDFTISDNSRKADGSKLKVFEAAYRSILDELIDDAIWELCFEVHRAAKLSYFFLEDTERKYKVYQGKDVEVHTQGKKTVLCPICKKSKGTVNYAKHLFTCMGGKEVTRNSFRKASQKIINFKECDSNSDDYTDSVNFVPCAPKKRSKKNQGKKGARRKPKLLGNSSSETNTNYQEMTYENRKAFFNQMCGVISKRTSKMCMNTHKCSQHTDEQRRDVRHILLRDMEDQLTSDGQIDIDTVDEGSARFSFITQALTAPLKTISSTIEREITVTSRQMELHSDILML